MNIQQTIALDAYKKAINSIDDYFEYRNKSIADRRVVQAILARLTDDLWTAATGTKENT